MVEEAEAPCLSSTNDVRKAKSVGSDLQFEERLQAVKRSALQQKKAEEEKAYGAIDYDAPVESTSTTIGLGTRLKLEQLLLYLDSSHHLRPGFLFYSIQSVSPTEEIARTDKRIAEDERANLLKTLQQFEATLASSPEDPTSLEGAAVTLAELGEYNRASSLLEDLIKKKPSDPDVYRLLGEVKYGLKDYEGSAAAFRMSVKMSGAIDFEVLRGLTNALIAAKKPDEAVQMLRKSLKEEKTIGSNDGTKNGAVKSKSEVDPIQVDLLLGKAYSEWGRVSDVVSVYNQLTSTYPDDFRGYLAKGIILKENRNVGDAERMFIQARFFAPENAKVLVDKYAK
ncbi:hypothetical protein K7X08_034153 [Anisodus acutangulus]|uniref:Uncharacterized protein n=1 Tax=Anisodus acutangulus TaxID=402998 RepID=A0A9Q1LHQ9_9SOLA|nr:hypothetical protein K7X08_034153 [Anisodus acutangulus]